MTSKKSKQADLEHKRKVLLPLGLAVAAAITLTAFEWTTASSSTFRESIEEKSSLTLEPVYEEKVKKEKEIFDQPIRLSKLKSKDDQTDLADSKSLLALATETDEAENNDEVINSNMFDPGEEFGKINIGRGGGHTGGCDLTKNSYELNNTARYVGGDNAMYNFLGKHISYPELARRLGKTGKVFIEFVIDTEGNVGSAKILGDPFDMACANEALAAVKKMPKWIPGEQFGKKVNVRFQIPITFKLD